MIRSFLEMMMGEVGRQILYFYEANACVINSIILTYGLFMFLCWNNLVRVYRYLVVEVAKNIHLDDELGRKSTNKRVRDTIEIPWQQAVEVAPFPFVGQIGALLPRRMSVETLKIYFDEKEIVDAAMKVLKGTHIKAIAPSSKKIGERMRNLRLGKQPPPEENREEETETQE